MRIEMVQGTIRLLTALPSTFVHAFNLLVSATRSLVLLSARDGNEGIYLGQWVRLFVNRLSTVDRLERMGGAYLTGSWSSTGWCALGRSARPW